MLAWFAFVGIEKSEREKESKMSSPNEQNVAAIANSDTIAAAAAKCSKCSGPVPWEETNPHAHDANGEICSECGHFYGTPPYQGRCNETLLTDYCFAGAWEAAMKRVAYAPKEANHPGHNNCTALHWAVCNGAPVELIRALIEAFPKAVSLSSNIGCPLWVLIKTRRLSERVLEIAELMVHADRNVLRALSADDIMETLLGYVSCRFASLLRQASERPVNESMETVFAYQTESIPSTNLKLLFSLVSLLVKAESGNERLIHAIAGCRDPFFRSKSLLLLAIRFYPQQLLEVDNNGALPIHIAASTVNRDKKVYSGFFEEMYDEFDSDMYEDGLDEYLNSLPCKHYTELYMYLEFECKHDTDGENFSGCDCNHNDEDDDSSCGCWSHYMEQQTAICDCEEKFEELPPCHCFENYREYHKKMKDEHRRDKKNEILQILKACPESARRRDKDGNLPLHLAVSSGKKWECGVHTLLQAFPEALRMRDCQHCLFPFMLAARGERHDVDVTFELLRADPSCLSNVTSSGGEAVLMENTSRGEKRKFPQCSS